jgi:hypothetical protein
MLTQICKYLAKIDKNLLSAETPYIFCVFLDVKYLKN